MRPTSVAVQKPGEPFAKQWTKTITLKAHSPLFRAATGCSVVADCVQGRFGWIVLGCLEEQQTFNFAPSSSVEPQRLHKLGVFLVGPPLTLLCDGVRLALLQRVASCGPIEQWGAGSNRQTGPGESQQVLPTRLPNPQLGHALSSPAWTALQPGPPGSPRTFVLPSDPSCSPLSPKLELPKGKDELIAAFCLLLLCCC